MRAAPNAEIVLFSLLGAALCVGGDFAVNGPQAGVMKGAALLASAGATPLAAFVISSAGLLGAGAASGQLFRPLTRRGAATLAAGLVAIIALVLPPASGCAVGADLEERVAIDDEDASATEPDRAFILDGLEMGVHLLARCAEPRGEIGLRDRNP